jgi:hypothetical protein
MAVVAILISGSLVEHVLSARRAGAVALVWRAVVVVRVRDVVAVDADGAAAPDARRTTVCGGSVAF